MSTAGLFAGIASAGGCDVSSAGASCGSVFWWPASPQSVPVSRLPPWSVAAGVIAQLAGPWIGPEPVLTVVRFPATIEPWKFTVALAE